MMSRRQGRKQMSSAMVEEPCTLVYTLLTASKVPYNEFSLIIRSLHKYMVEAIDEHESARTIHVKLGFQASIKNAYLKLGPLLSQHILITKLSQFVKDEELPLLDELRRKYCFGPMSDATTSPAIGQVEEDDEPGNSGFWPAPLEYQTTTTTKPKKRRTNQMPILVEENESQEHS